jgi:arsenite methyltransferase
LPADSVDVVISNCVIKLSIDKAAMLAALARVLKPGGRVGVSDVVAEDRLSPEERAARGSYVGCIAGALSKSDYEAGLKAAGFTDVSVECTHEVADGRHGADRARSETGCVNVLFACVQNAGRSQMAEARRPGTRAREEGGHGGNMVSP